MFAGIHISQEIVAISMLTALKTPIELDRKHVLRLLRPYGEIVTTIWRDCYDYLESIWRACYDYMETSPNCGGSK